MKKHIPGRNELAVVLSAVVIWGPTAARATTSEDGGSGLVNVDHAWSMPVTGLVLSTYAGTLSSDASSRSTRVFTFTPSVTKGLGAGFEAAAAVPFEGLSQSLNDDDFDRRFDVRRRDVVGKLRWTQSLGSPRARAGVQGLIGLPLDDLNATRAGGSREPDNAFDPAIVGLFSANLGGFSFPLRVHVNAGYWWSRNDGAVYYRTLPVAVPLESDEISNNDVAVFGAGAEAGFRRFVLFAEIYTEQLMGARAQIKSRENLWRFTPGVRTEIAQNIGLTGSVSFDVSRNDDATAFDPSSVYADTHVRVGLTLGNVLTRNTYEGRGRRPRTAWPLVTAAELDSTVAAESATASEPIVEERRALPAARAEVRPVSTTQMAVPPIREAGSMDEIARRVERLETELRLRDLEARLASIEGRPPGVRGADPVPAVTRAPVPAESPAAPEIASAEVAAPAPAPPVPVDVPASVAAPDTGSAPQTPEAPDAMQELLARVSAMQQEIETLREARQRPVASPSDVPRAREPVPAAVAPSVQQEPPAAPVTIVTETPVRQPGSLTVIQTPPPAAPAPAPVAPAAPLESPRGAETGAEGNTHGIWAELDALTAELERDHATPAAALHAPAPPIAERVEGEPTRPAAQIPAQTFPLAVGEERVIDGVTLGANPVANDEIRVALDAWSELLATHADVVVGVLVYADAGAAREKALSETESQARSLRDYLVVAGVAADRVVAMGMGAADAESGARVVVERLR